MPERICSVEGCAKAAAKRGWCPMHYQRWRQHGDLTRERQPRPPVLCSIQGCRERHEANGLCNRHYICWRTHGDPHILAFKSGSDHHSWVGSEDLVYSTAHNRVRAARGPADHCSYPDCRTGSVRFEWANLTGAYGDIEDYAPMCKVHHSRYDNERRTASGGNTRSSVRLSPNQR